MPPQVDDGICGSVGIYLACVDRYFLALPAWRPVSAMSQYGEYVSSAERPDVPADVESHKCCGTKVAVTELPDHTVVGFGSSTTTTRRPTGITSRTHALTCAPTY